MQNGSFEYYSSINCSIYDITSNVYSWSTLSSPDYYNAICGSSVAGVTSSINGHQIPINGNAYIGILGFYKPSNVKEYIYQNLSVPLIAGKTYYVGFYVSLSDRAPYSIKNMGINFSIAAPTLINGYVSANPQLENQSSYLSDTIGWTKIEGYFKAQGSEQYMTIGNFNSNANTDTLRSGTLNPIPFEPDEAYYLIDSVSLYDSLDYALITNIKHIADDIKVNLYPNPNNGNFKLEYHITKEAEFVITDITGRLVNQYALLPSQNNLLIKEEELNAGVYLYSIKMNNSIIKNDRLIIIK